MTHARKWKMSHSDSHGKVSITWRICTCNEVKEEEMGGSIRNSGGLIYGTDSWQSSPGLCQEEVSCSRVPSRASVLMLVTIIATHVWYILRQHSQKHPLPALAKTPDTAPTSLEQSPLSLHQLAPCQHASYVHLQVYHDHGWRSQGWDQMSHLQTHEFHLDHVCEWSCELLQVQAGFSPEHPYQTVTGGSRLPSVLWQHQKYAQQHCTLVHDASCSALLGLWALQKKVSRMFTVWKGCHNLTDALPHSAKW